MTMRNILVTMHAEVEPAPQLDAAMQIAHRFKGEIEALFVRPNAAAELATIPGAALTYGISYDVLEEAGLKRAARAREHFDAWRAAQAGLPRPGTWREHEGLLEAVVEHAGRLADLLVLRHPDRAVPETGIAFDAAVFGTGRPCLLVRDAMRASLLQHVLVAWNGSLEGTHAVAGAMPLLEVAGRVSVFSAPRSYDDVEHGHDLARGHVVSRVIGLIFAHGDAPTGRVRPYPRPASPGRRPPTRAGSPW